MQLKRLDEIWAKMLASELSITALHNSDKRCEVCGKPNRTIFTNSENYICADCHSLSPERFYCGNPHSPVPQGELQYRHGTGKFVKKFHTPSENE